MLKKNFIEKILIYFLICFSIMRASLYGSKEYLNYKYIFWISNICFVLFCVVYYFLKKRIELKAIFFSFAKIGYYLKFYSFIGIIGNFILFIFFNEKNIRLRRKGFKILLNIIFLLCFFSIIEYLYVLFIDDTFLTPNFIGNKAKYNWFYNIGFFNSFLENTNGERVKRILSIFNEPGYFGTFLGIFILFTKNENKFKMFIIYLAGCLTLSTAFVYFVVMKIFFESTSLKKICKSIVIVFILVNIVVISGNRNEYIRKNIVIKIEKIFKNKTLNRSVEVDRKRLKDFYKNGNIIWGEKKAFKGVDSNTFGELIYQFGIVGTVINIILFLNIANFFSVKNFKTRILILVALSSIIQRIDILDLTTLLCVYFGPTYYDLKITKNKRKELEYKNL